MLQSLFKCTVALFKEADRLHCKVIGLCIAHLLYLKSQMCKFLRVVTVVSAHILKKCQKALIGCTLISVIVVMMVLFMDFLVVFSHYLVTPIYSQFYFTTIFTILPGT